MVAKFAGARSFCAMKADGEIRNNLAASRYECTVDGHLSVADYELADGVMTITHTVVPPELRGRGIAEKLVRAALAEARASQRKVVPACSYVAVFIQRHAEFQDLVA